MQISRPVYDRARRDVAGVRVLSRLDRAIVVRSAKGLMRHNAQFLVMYYGPLIGRTDGRHRISVAHHAYSLASAFVWLSHRNRNKPCRFWVAKVKQPAHNRPRR